MKPKAVVLLSGGLDSAVTLFYAISVGYKCRCLIFDYGQRHIKEMRQAKKIARYAGSDITVVKLSFPWKGSSLLNKDERIPLDRKIEEITKGVPSTYVPGRNIVFLSIAASLAEAEKCSAIFIGAHFEDSSGYPDCRKEFLLAFSKALNAGTRAGMEKRLVLKFPLIEKTKKEIITLGKRLGVPFGMTWSCYSGLGKPCGRCDSCILRARGFSQAGLIDPATTGN